MGRFQQRQLTALTADASGGTVIWRGLLTWLFWQLAGFPPDGERSLTISERAIRDRTFAIDEEQAAVRYRGATPTSRSCRRTAGTSG